MTIKEALEEANKKLAPKIDNALSKEVFKVVTETESATINEVVYKVYKKPKIYKRRKKNGGLSDERNMIIKGGVASDNVLVVKNITPPNPSGVKNTKKVTLNKDLPSLVEYGDGYKGYHYDFDSDNTYMDSRPFTHKTVESLKKSKKHVVALKKGLKRQGVKTEDKNIK